MTWDTAFLVGRTVAVSILLSELAGYWIHRLLHSELIPFLSRSHMWHHLEDYAPGTNQRSDIYKDSSEDRFSLLGLGVEWLVPISAVVLLWSAGALLIGVSVWVTVLSVGTALAWGGLMFGYVHERFHVAETWMLRGKVGRWFRRARRLHDIHHHKLTDDGRMPYNMGIAFFWFDRVFGTYRKATGRFNASGVEQSRRLYSEIWNER